MNLKRAIAIFWCLAFLAWPALHFVLTRAFDTDPREFFGFAMDATPRRRVDIGFEKDTGDGFEFITKSGHPEGLVRTVRKFQKLRKTLGDLQGAHEVSEAFLAYYKDARAIRIRTVIFEVDRKTSRLRIRTILEEFPREGEPTRMIVVNEDGDGEEPPAE